MSDLSHLGAYRLIHQGHLSGAEKHALQAHLRQCEACRQHAALAGKLYNHLLLEQSPVRPSPQFTAVFMESAARRSRRGHIMKPIYAVGGAVTLALLMLAGWLIIKSNIQTTGLGEAPELPPISIPETQATAQSAVPEAAVQQPEFDVTEVDQQLFAAVGTGDVAEVERLLEAGASADAKDSNGNAALAKAAGDGQLDIVRLLLDAGADVNGTVKKGSTKGFLMIPGINESALSEAVIDNHVEIVELLIAYGADVDRAEYGLNRNALHYAALLINPEVIKILLENGADPDLPSDYEDGETPLHFAVERGSSIAVRALLDGGADVNAQTEPGLTPMMAALIDHDTEGNLSAMFLENGADPNIMDSNGRTALHYAAREGRKAAFPWTPSATGNMMALTGKVPGSFQAEAANLRTWKDTEPSGDPAGSGIPKNAASSITRSRN